MYKIKLNSKKAEKLDIVNFSDLKLKERFDIEVWVKNNPSILKEDLLIISEQIILPSGRQPDLIALDREGNLVIIELKRDDSGRDVYWQAISYAAQFSEYSYTDIIKMYEDYRDKNENEGSNSYESIENFIEAEIEELNQKQRLIMVSKEFHQDVLKASLWLLDYEVPLKVVKLTPYRYSEDLLILDSEVLIPTPGVEDYIRNRSDKIKKADRGYATPWWSLKKGNYDDEELKLKLKESFTRKTNLTKRLVAFFEILVSRDEFVNRDEIKEKFYNNYDFGNNVGHAGTLLSNVSQFITKKRNDHLRQVIEFEMPEESEGKPKDKYRIVPIYRQLVKEVLNDISTE